MNAQLTMIPITPASDRSGSGCPGRHCRSEDRRGQKARSDQIHEIHDHGDHARLDGLTAPNMHMEPIIMMPENGIATAITRT